MTFQLILERKLIFPDTDGITSEAKDLIDNLLQLDHKKRLGA